MLQQNAFSQRTIKLYQIFYYIFICKFLFLFKPEFFFNKHYFKKYYYCKLNSRLLNWYQQLTYAICYNKDVCLSSQFAQTLVIKIHILSLSQLLFRNKFRHLHIIKLVFYLSNSKIFRQIIFYFTYFFAKNVSN